MSHPSKKRVFGVKQTPAEEPKRYSRPEGTHTPIETTVERSAGATAGTMAPKRWQERQNDR